MAPRATTADEDRDRFSRHSRARPIADAGAWRTPAPITPAGPQSEATSACTRPVRAGHRPPRPPRKGATVPAPQPTRRPGPRPPWGATEPAGAPP